MHLLQPCHHTPHPTLVRGMHLLQPCVVPPPPKVRGYRRLLREKRLELGDKADKLKGGLHKLDETSVQVGAKRGVGGAFGRLGRWGCGGWEDGVICAHEGGWLGVDYGGLAGTPACQLTAYTPATPLDRMHAPPFHSTVHRWPP